MTKRNTVYIATSLDGYIADKDGGIDWLESTPNPEDSDMGFNEFNEQIDAMVMGRNTFETVCAFDIDWPYKMSIFLLSKSLNEIPDQYEGKAFYMRF